MFSDINILAAVVSAIAVLVLGWVWYSPMMFGAMWAKLMGFDMTDPSVLRKMKKKMPMNMFLGVVTNTIFAIGLTMVFTAFGVATMMQALAIALILYIAFTLTEQVGGVLWGMQPWRLFFLNGAFAAVAIFIGTLIIYGWIF